MKHSHSDIDRSTGATHLAFSLVAVLAVVLPSFGLFGALITTDRYIVPEGERITEDQYVTSTSAVVDGTVDGNLTVFTGSLRINGTVTGSVTVFTTGTVTVADGASIGGSLNGTAGSVNVLGSVGTDLFVAAGATVIEEPGTIGRDVIGFGGTLRVEGSVDRDVRGRAYRITVDGQVGGDVDVAAQSLGIGPTAVIGGDVLYRSPAEASISDQATIAGTVTRLPTQSNFIYSLIVSIANVVSFLGFLVAGIVTIWVVRGTSSRAVAAVLQRPIRSLLVGLVTVIVFPLAVGLLAVTLVGIPLAVVLIALGVVVFVVGAVPAVTALGNLVLFKRGGLFGAFIVGAIIWRLSFFIPWVGAFLFVLGVVWGVGAWVLGAVGSRRADPVPAALFPSIVSDRTETAADWEPPLAPGMTALEADDDVEVPEPPSEDDGEEASRELEQPEPEATDSTEDVDGPPNETSEPEAAASDTGFRLDDGFGDDEVEADDHAEADDGRPMPGEPTEDDRTAIVGDRVSFGEPEPSASAAGQADDAAGRGRDSDDGDVSGTTHDEDEDSDLSLSERFQALRDELLATGTVEPVDRPEQDDDDGEAPSGDWGLPDR